MKRCPASFQRVKSVQKAQEWKRELSQRATYNKFLPSGSTDRLDHLEEGVHSVQRRCVRLSALYDVVVLLQLHRLPPKASSVTYYDLAQKPPKSLH